jgi:hypothetical protein
MLFQVMKIKLLLILFAGNFAMVDSAIGKNCSFELPPPGFHVQLEGCPSTVNMEAPNLCMVPDSRCTLGCPGLCDENEASLEYCIISFECIWRLIPNNDNQTSTPSPSPNTQSGLTKGSWMAIIALIVLISIVVFGGMLSLIVFFIWKKLYPRGQNLSNVLRGSNNHLVEFVEMEQLDGNTSPPNENSENVA